MIAMNQSLGSGVVAAGSEMPLDLPIDWPNREYSRRVAAAGRSWHVQIAGAGPDVVLLHGTGAATHSWHQLLPMAATRYRVIAVDLPGHGFTSRHRREALTLAGISRDLSELLTHLGVDPVAIVGHSAAAAIAVELLSAAQFKSASMLGLNPALMPYGAGFRPVLVPMTRWAAESRLVTRWITSKARDSRSVRRVLVSTGSSVDDEQVLRYQRLLREKSHVRAMLSMMGHWDLGDALSKLAAFGRRALLVYGEDDLAVPVAQLDTVRNRAPQCRYQVLKRLGHLAHEESPVAALELIHQVVADRGEQGRI